MEFILLLFLIGGIALILWGVLAFVRGIGKALSATVDAPKPSTNPAGDEIDGMNNGDYYNGPHGYSPMTGYLQTQYGSGFNPDAAWDERDQ